MSFLSSLMNALPGAVAQGLAWGIMAIGVYITFRILDVADLTVDGSLATGGAVCVMLIRAGVNPWLAMLCALVSGMLAGLITGLFHTRVRHPRHSGRYSDAAGSVLHQSANHGRQGQSGRQRGQVRPAAEPAVRPHAVAG